MAKKCPRGFVCTDWNTIFLYVLIAAMIVGGAWFVLNRAQVPAALAPTAPKPTVIVVPTMQQPVQAPLVRPDLYPEPVQRGGYGSLPALASRGPSQPFQQVGLLTGEGGSSGAAAPDRTVLPLYGRELDARRGKWNYYTRTDGHNPVQVPVRVRNRVCDDDTVGCDELFSDDTVHVPVLGRSFTATVYKKSLFA
jgi:Family of unknown function (DUF5755)